MTLAWPLALLAVVLIPLGLLLARSIDRRRRRRVSALTGTGPGTTVAPGPGRRRGAFDRVGPALVVLALVVLVVGLARPQATVALPSLQGTLVLTFDVSASMGATDVSPSRMEAAKAAARAIVNQQPPGVVIGVVAFSDSGLTVQPPTTDTGRILATIDRLAPTRGTSLGNGILTTLDAIAKSQAPVPPGYYSNRSPEPTATPAPVAPGSDAATMIVLLSDGENNVRPDPATAAQAAADRGIRIITLGVGTASGATLDLDGFQVQSRLDEATLQQVADTTGGVYELASDSTFSATAVYDELARKVTVHDQQVELTALLAAAGLVLLVAGAAISLIRTGGLP